LAPHFFASAMPMARRIWSRGYCAVVAMNFEPGFCIALMASGAPSTLASFTSLPLASMAASAPMEPPSFTLKMPFRSLLACRMFSVTVSAVARSCLPFCVLTTLMPGYLESASRQPFTRSRIGTTGMPSRMATSPFSPMFFAR